MALIILALLQLIFIMSSLILLLVWLIFFMVLIMLLPIFFFYCYGALRDLHSFPTRRSSDLKGLFWKVIVPMVTSPVAGLVLGFFVMATLYVIFRNARPLWINRIFGRAQMASAGAMGFMHGKIGRAHV